MLKKTITFEDLDGNKVTQDFYFNLSTAELAEMELEREGGFRSYLQEILDNKDQRAIIASFREIIRKTIGRREGDTRFVKSEQIADEFMQTDAYSVLFLELMQHPMAAAEFVAAVVPSKISERVNMDELAGKSLDELRAISQAEPQAAPLSVSVLGQPVEPTDADVDAKIAEIYGLAPVAEKKLDDYTRDELIAMSWADFDRIAGTKPGKWSRDVLRIAFERNAKNPRV